MATKEVVKQAKPITAEIREARGSRKTQFIRAQNKIPAIIYGLKKETVAITLPLPEVVSVLQSGSHILDVSLNGQGEKFLIQAVQYDYLNANVEHVDLLRIDPKKKVHVKVSLEFRGTPKGTKEGGILEIQTPEIELEVSPLEIPSTIRVNVEHLEMHQILHAKEVALPAGTKLLDFAEKIICQVRTVKEEVAAVVAEAGPAEPEVIGKKKEEEGAEGAVGADGKPVTAKAAAPAKK